MMLWYYIRTNFWLFGLFHLMLSMICDASESEISQPVATTKQMPPTIIRSLRSVELLKMAYFQAISELARLKIVSFDNSAINFTNFEYLKQDSERFSIEIGEFYAIFSASMNRRLGDAFNLELADHYFRWTIAALFDPTSHHAVCVKIRGSLLNFMQEHHFTASNILRAMLCHGEFDSILHSIEAQENRNIPPLMNSYKDFVDACCGVFHANMSYQPVFVNGITEIGSQLQSQIKHDKNDMLSSYQGFNALAILYAHLVVNDETNLSANFNIQEQFLKFHAAHDLLQEQYDPTCSFFKYSADYVNSELLDNKFNFFLYFCQCFDVVKCANDPEDQSIFESSFYRTNTTFQSLPLIEKVEPIEDPQKSVDEICEIILTAYKNAHAVIPLTTNHPISYQEKTMAYYMYQIIQYSSQLEMKLTVPDQVQVIIDLYVIEKQQFYPSKIFIDHEVTKFYSNESNESPYSKSFFDFDFWFYIFEVIKGLSLKYCVCFDRLLGFIHYSFFTSNIFSTDTAAKRSEIIKYFETIEAVIERKNFLWKFFEDTFFVRHVDNETSFEKRYMTLALAETLTIAANPPKDEADKILLEIDQSNSQNSSIEKFLMFLPKIRSKFEQALDEICIKYADRPLFMDNKKYMLEKTPDTILHEELNSFIGGFRDALSELEYPQHYIDGISTEFFVYFIQPSLEYLWENYKLTKEVESVAAGENSREIYKKMTLDLFNFIHERMEFSSMLVTSISKTTLILETEKHFQIVYACFWYQLNLIFDSLFYTKNDFQHFHQIIQNEHSICDTISNNNIFLLFEGMFDESVKQDLFKAYCNPNCCLLQYSVFASQRIYKNSVNALSDVSPTLMLGFAIRNLSNEDFLNSNRLRTPIDERFEEFKVKTPYFDENFISNTAVFAVKMLYATFCEIYSVPEMMLRDENEM